MSKWLTKLPGYQVYEPGLERKVLYELPQFTVLGSLAIALPSLLARFFLSPKAERIIAEELERHGWQESDLAARRKSDAVKLGMAARLRRETTLSTKGIGGSFDSWSQGSSFLATRGLRAFTPLG